jgi:tetratricopeptide (TPR) repeat protein
MKSALLSLMVVAPWTGAWAQCTGAEFQLLSVSNALSREDTQKAEQALDVIEHSHPNCPESLLDRGRLFYLQGDTSSAENALESYIRLQPDDARSYAYLAQIFLEQQQYQRADNASLMALDKNPIDATALALRGQILAMKGHLDEGITLLEQAIQYGPDDAEAHYQLGMLYARAKRRGDAAKEFQKALAIVPGNARAWDYLALSLEPLGEVEDAEDAYKKGEAVNKPGRHFDGFLDYNYGRFLAKLNRLNEAKGHLDRAVELAPNVRAVWYERAKLDISLKNYPAARADAEKAESLPDTGGVVLDLQMYNLLEEIYRRLGEKELADKYADLSRKTPGPGQQLQ